MTTAPHTDHPSRHFDRTCPACVREGQGDARKHQIRANALEDAAQIVEKMTARQREILSVRWPNTMQQCEIAAAIRVLT